MASRLRPSRDRFPPCPEAGFSLVEVLAALAIASLVLILAMQVLVQSARLDARLTHETAARDLARRLLAEGVDGRGMAGVLGWQVTSVVAAKGLVLRQVQVSWPGGPELETDRLEAAP
jgi:prepilin-type N-terminal cleavage/methylation domain-containing protein